MTISLCMIVKDEESVLSRCLSSVSGLFDEIILVDTGSSDQTPAIARRFTDNVFSFPWQDDFSKARNFSFSRATGDYLFWLDADDVLPPPSRERFPALRTLLEREHPDVLFLPYDTAFGEDGTPSLTFRRERVLRRSEKAHWVGRVHGRKERKDRNLRIYQKWAAEEPLSARDLFYYGRELYYHRLYPEAVARLEQALSSDGWYVNQIEACKILSLCLEEQGRLPDAECALFRSFLYGEPRASACCELGRLFFAQKRFREAAFWYQSALSCRDHSEEGDFELPAARTLTPLLGLVCSFDALGDRERARAFHKRTKELFPDHPAVRHNHAYFAAQESE